MASMKRIKTDLLALGLAAAVTALCADHASVEESIDSKVLTCAQARAASAPYLDDSASDARLHRTAQRWAVTDGHTTAWLDAHTGELVELSFAAPRSPSRE